ncbi:MAG: TetR/AcrR family transcriptional regulator [Paracoccaceae bacterium]|nr:TetR/AcrR family transcriptional regulator [Paracoccaceae bacterium]
MAKKTERGAAPAYRRRKEHRPDEIIAAGLEEFYEHGFSGARLDRIAQSAGISRATLYLYFENKEALFAAVADHAIGTFIDSQAHELTSVEGSTRDLIERMVRTFYREIVSHKSSAILRILISEGERYPTLVERYHRIIMTRGRQTLRAILDRGIARGEIRPGPAAKFEEIIPAPAMFYLIVHMVFGAHQQIDADVFLEAHLDLLFNGLLTPEARDTT